MLDFLLRCIELKDVDRTGWQLRGVDRPEDVAAHSWNTAFLVMVFGDEADIDVDRAVKMAIVHDLAEAETGDIPRDGEEWEEARQTKEEDERAAMQDLFDGIDRDTILGLWEEYEARETDEARFVKDMDLIDMALQALRYEEQERYGEENREEVEASDDLGDMLASAERRLRTPTGREIFDRIEERYEQVTD
ncbi:MAG: HD domain-containing protein [Candidatus Nanohaloarchaea archaeon]|nr:HD domain-containing protein [Candidatus Nanohaloarchaea archaeon]